MQSNLECECFLRLSDFGVPCEEIKNCLRELDAGRVVVVVDRKDSLTVAFPPKFVWWGLESRWKNLPPPPEGPLPGDP